MAVHQSESLWADVLTLPGLGKALGTLATILVLYRLITTFYNISPLHPLYHIPGPKLAAASYLPEFYHDVILLGRYTHEIRKMHEQYGPIVRISPNELHCNDPDFADAIYALGGRKRDKPLHQVHSTLLRLSGFGTVDHDLHRARRAPVAKFFTRNMIARLEDRVAAMAQQLCDKMLAQRNVPFDLMVAYSNFTTDVASGYCFGETFGLLDQPGWEPSFHKPIMALIRPTHLFRFWPVLKSFTKIGVWFVDWLPEATQIVIRTLQIDTPNRVRKTIENLDAGVIYEQPTIVGAIMASDLSTGEKKPGRVSDESLAVVGAGTETTAWALAVTTFHLKSNPEVFRRLTYELQQAVRDPKQLPSWTALEKLPYFSAVIQEGLRVSHGVSGRTARVATEEDLSYQGEWKGKKIAYVLPKGYAIGMSAAIAHYDEEIFPEASTFKPERWLVGYEQRAVLDRGILTFSRGSRACVGMNLALCELHCTLAALTLRILPHLDLHETTEDDVRYDYDLIASMPKPDSKGVRAIMRSD